MNPRHKMSLKWTPFPVELIEQISSVFTQNFKTYLGNSGTLVSNGKIFQREIMLRISLHRKGELKYMNFEASADYNPQKENHVFDQIGVCVDVLAGLVADYFENNEELEIPYTWSEIKFEGQSVWIQHSTENPDLEAEADKLLGLSSDQSLLKNSDEDRSEDILDATEEEFDQFSEEISKDPQMLKKKKKEDLH